MENCDGPKEQADEDLENILKKHGKEFCPKCNRKIDRGDVAWNEGSTEAGTPYSVLEIACLQCGTEIAHKYSWSWVESFDDFICALEEEWD